ncbi:MAG: iron-containing alcohol dehydrogenase [Vicinamibacterales bacterium]
MPPQVAASSGLDILSHAIESFTAIPFTGRPRPERPALRPAYQGSNPISDVWSMEALRLVARFLVRAVEDPDDDEARASMILAASYAGVGFGNAGVHLPHGMSYPVSGHVRTFRAPGYAVDHPIVPHGMSVILNAPAVFRFTAPSSPARHLEAAAALGADVSGRRPDDAGAIPPSGSPGTCSGCRCPTAWPPWATRRRMARTRRGHAAPAPGDEAVAAPGRARGPLAALRDRHDSVVAAARPFPGVTMSRVVLALSLLLSASLPSTAQSVVLVRHAERADTSAGGSPTMAADPDLSAAGHARATRLAAMLKDAGITAIFVTQYKRTQQTAAPLAKALGLVPVVMQADDTPALLARLRAVKGHALVVGHSNTVPELAAALSEQPAIEIGDDEYDNLLVVSRGPQPRLLRLRY